VTTCTGRSTSIEPPLWQRPSPPARAADPPGVARAGDQLEQVQRVLEAVLHARLEDRVANVPARALDELLEPRAPVDVDEGDGVDRRTRVGGALVDLGRDDPLVGDDLPVLAVEGDLHAVVGDHRGTPLAADAKVDVGDRRLAAVGVPPALDQLRGGPRLVDEVLGGVELPRDEDLLIRGKRHHRAVAIRHCHHLLAPFA
jgi:hypothetical protein